jgi:flagellar biosynthesis/type III secretory pathway M-ring protein FliF/YscJ
MSPKTQVELLVFLSLMRSSPTLESLLSGLDISFREDHGVIVTQSRQNRQHYQAGTPLL